jgi:hypothetical protein
MALWTPRGELDSGTAFFAYDFPIVWADDTHVGGWERAGADTARAYFSDPLPTVRLANQGLSDRATYLCTFTPGGIVVSASHGESVPGWDLGGGWYAYVADGFLLVSTAVIAGAVAPPPWVSGQGGMLTYDPTMLYGFWVADPTERVGAAVFPYALPLGWTDDGNPGGWDTLPPAP